MQKLRRRQIPPLGIQARLLMEHSRTFGITLNRQEILERFSGCDMGEQLFSMARLMALFEMDHDSSRPIVEQVAHRATMVDDPSHFILPALQRAVSHQQVINAPHVLLNAAKHILAYADPTTLGTGRRALDDFRIPLTSLYLSSLISASVESDNTPSRRDAGDSEKLGLLFQNTLRNTHATKS